MPRGSKKSPSVKKTDMSFEPIKRNCGGAEWSDEQLLDILANTINDLRKRASSDLLEIGYRLIEAKALAGHGNWLPWLEHNFGWTEQTALNCMRLYELNKSKTVLDLDLPLKALYQLAAPSTPPEAVDTVIDRVGAGEKLSGADVKNIIDEAKQPTKKHDPHKPGNARRGLAEVRAAAHLAPSVFTVPKTKPDMEDDPLGRTSKRLSETATALAQVCKVYTLGEIIAVLIDRYGFDAVSDEALEHNL